MSIARLFGLATLLCLATTSVAGEVPAAYRRTAVLYGIPADIFYAIALTESGRTVDSMVRPWPWTLNIEGEGAYFVNRRTAWQAAVTAILNGKLSVDLGPMQVNWRYHRSRLRTPWRALDPSRNLLIAAEILAHCYQRRQDWWQSVGCYHAPSDAARAARYTERVRTVWATLANRKREP